MRGEAVRQLVMLYELQRLLEQAGSPLSHALSTVVFPTALAVIAVCDDHR
jgi:hypothetical protein